MKQLRLTVGDVTLHADLLYDEAPQTCAAIEELGAFGSTLFSANVCFGEFTFAVPLPGLMATENVQPKTHAGQVSWYPDWQCVCVFTQEMEQFGATPQFAEICEDDLPLFQELAADLWHEQGIPAIVEVAEKDAELADVEVEGWRGFSREGVPEGAQGLVEMLDAQMKSLWFARPDELSQMVARNAETGREAAVWAYAWSELVNLGDMLISIADIARAGRGDAATLALVAAEQCRFFSGVFESSSHMPGAKAVLEAAADGISCCTTHEELLAVIRPVQGWCAQMGFWTSAELPWDSVCDVTHIEWNPEFPDPNWPGDLELDEEEVVYIFDGEGEDKPGKKKDKKGKKKDKKSKKKSKKKDKKSKKGKKK